MGDASGLKRFTRGFRGRQRDQGQRDRLPPGQYLVRDFPVLSAGPTPRIPMNQWDFRVLDADGSTIVRWNWEQFRSLPTETVMCDIHCVTKWTKLDTTWQGVSLDVLLEGSAFDAAYAMVFADGEYSTNLPVADITGGKAWIATSYDGSELAPEHGGPARMLVPHLYFWKSAKWIAGLRLLDHDEPGFWEVRGYHNHGDPWSEERYDGD
jgi:DMSO/TMAO reductase YedYZ molybdopterin-dependent catalytic subunit